MSTTAHKRLFASVWLTYFSICMLAFIWPVATVANVIEPRVFGFPFLFFWYLLWVLLIFLGSVAMYIWDARLLTRRSTHA